MDLRNAETAREMRAALGDALKTRSQQFLDNLMIQLVIEDDCDADLLGQLLVEALAEQPQDVKDYWQSPCPCGGQHEHLASI